MPKPISFGELDFKIVASMEETRAVPEPETPFRILILGAFSGREQSGTSASGTALAGRRAIEVDRDNLDEVMAGMKPEIQLQFTGSENDAVTIRFAELDDFHPDRLCEQHEIFEALREIRRKLDNPRTFEDAAKEIRSWTESEALVEIQHPPEEPSKPAPDTGAVDTAGLLDQIMEGSERGPSAAQPSSDTSEWSRFLKNIVQPHLVPGKDPRQIELEATINAAAAALMRIILHHPNFQALESAWRALHFLVSRLETDALLKLYILDISKTELAADLNDANDLRTTGIYKLLVEQTVGTVGGEPWALIAGNYTFGQTHEDAELLGRMAKIAAAAGAPFIAAAHPNLLGCDSLVQTPDPDDWQTTKADTGDPAWQALQNMPEAAYLGLALPRFLLRLPYGADTDPLEQFDFEEMTDDQKHEDYLWGNPCFAGACLLGQAFNAYGWDMRPGAVQDVSGLPLHVYQETGETRIKPCAEVDLTERAAEIILDKGFMLLLSFRDQDMIRLIRFQSLALPPKLLAGRWKE
jgi:type VI secretion system protein ImpC